MGKKKESAFMRDINNIIKEENVVTTISEEDAHINYCGDELDEGVFKKGDYLYTFNGTIYGNSCYYMIDYSVIRSKINDNVGDIISMPCPVIFNDFMIEKAVLQVRQGRIIPSFGIISKYKKNACSLCSDTKTFCCYKSHCKSKKHIKNVVKRNKMYADTIEDATKLNSDVCMLITSYLF
jgi:hypothetical protein